LPANVIFFARVRGLYTRSGASADWLRTGKPHQLKARLLSLTTFIAVDIPMEEASPILSFLAFAN
jgi:hypothetical protein